MDEDAIDLLGKLLVFDPCKCITIEEALSHHYLVSLHGISEEPKCTVNLNMNSLHLSFNCEGKQTL